MATTGAVGDHRWLRRAQTIVIVVGLLALGLVAVGWWAVQHGYLAPDPVVGAACVLTRYDQQPSYDELVNDLGYSPYCARLQRDETWYEWLG